MKKYIFIFSILFILCFIGIVSAVGTYPNVDPSMVLYYHFNNDSSVGENYFNSNTIFDYSNYLNNGTNNNATYISSGSELNDGYFSLNGTQLITIPHNNSLNIDQSSNYSNFSMSVWVNTFGWSATGNNWILAKGESDKYQYAINLDNAGKPMVNFWKWDGTPHCSATSSNTITLNSWTYLVGTLNSTSCSIYVNGSLKAIGSRTFTANISGGTLDNNLYIGKRGDGNGKQFNGSIDEVIIYKNKSLTLTEILKNYNSYVGLYNITGDCYYFSNNLTVSSSMNLCPNNYYSNLSTVITITSSNVIFDCNNSLIQGNWSKSGDLPNSVGIQIGNYNNVTIKNCNLKKFLYAIQFGNSNNNSIFNNNISINDYGILSNTKGQGNNTLIYSNNISNSSDDSILTWGSNNLIYNNYFDKAVYYGVYIKTGNNNSIYNNIMNKITGVGLNILSTNNKVYGNNISGLIAGSYSLFIGNSSSNSIYNNNFNNVSGYLAMDFNSFNNSIYSNNFTNCTQYVCLYDSRSHDNFIYNNSFNINSKAITIYNSSNSNYYSNSINHSDSNYDGWNVGIEIDRRSNNLSIYNNTIENYGTLGILLRNSTNINISGNYFNQDTLQNRAINGVTSYLEINAGIGVLELYKSWYGDGTETTISLLKSQGYRSYNVSISGNTFGSNVQVKLHNQGGVNVTHDLTDYTYRKFAFPSEWLDPSELYITNLFTNISIVNYSTINNNIGQDWKHGYHFNAIENLFSTYSYFKNYNQTIAFNLSLFNLSSPLISFSNGTSIYNSFSNFDLNISLNPNEYVYIYNYSTFNTTKSFTNALILWSNLTIQKNDLSGYYTPIFDPSTNQTYIFDNCRLENQACTNTLRQTFTQAQINYIYAQLNYQQVQNTNGFCDGLTGQFNGLSTLVVTIISLLGLVITIGIILIIVIKIQNPDAGDNFLANISEQNNKYVIGLMVGIVVLVSIIITILFLVTSICHI